MAAELDRGSRIPPGSFRSRDSPIPISKSVLRVIVQVVQECGLAGHVGQQETHVIFLPGSDDHSFIDFRCSITCQDRPPSVVWYTLSRESNQPRSESEKCTRSKNGWVLSTKDDCHVSPPSVVCKAIARASHLEQYDIGSKPWLPSNNCCPTPQPSFFDKK